MDQIRHVLARDLPQLVGVYARDVNQSADSNIGSSKSNKPASASQLVSTLVPVLLVALAWMALFLWARPRYPWNYSPRTQSKLLKSDEYTTALPPTLTGWFKTFFSIPDEYVLQHSSLDAYFFLRFLKMSVVICLFGSLITWPILFPIFATGGGGQAQLNILTFGNVKVPWRHYGTVGCMYILFFFIFFMIAREMVYYINLRQAYLMNPAYATKLPSRTVLYTAVPEPYLNEAKIRAVLGPQVQNVWIPTDTKELDDLVEERDKAAMTLEGAETKLIMTANGERLKAAAKGGASHDLETAPQGADRWITPKMRPTHRKPMLIGKKLDSINWSREELIRLTPLIEESQAKHRAVGAKKLGAVFVEFTTLGAAQAAYQSLTHHQMLKMAPRFTGMAPAEVIWKNLRITGWQRFLRTWITTAIVIVTIIYWSVPVAFVGTISNINYWIGPDGKTPWLNFLNKVPTVIFGVITGLLPTVLLAVLMALLPPFLRWMAKLGGSPTLSDVEYKVSNYYFGFQVVQVFLVTTLSSAVSGSVFQIISNPGSAPNLLAQNLPTSNSFYLSYIILQGLGVVSGLLAGISGLIVTPLLARFLGGTPRKLFMTWNKLQEISYGTVFPIYTNMLVIAISYSCIAPLVTGFTAIGLYFFYLAYRYNILYIYSTGPDTKGMLYPRAMSQLFVGLYIAEICMIGLLGISLGGDAKAAIGPFILSIILLVITALFQIALSSATKPLLLGLPKTIEAEEREIVRTATNTATNGEKADLDQELTGTSVVAPKLAKPSMFQKFLKPHVYSNYATLRRLMPTEISTDIDEMTDHVLLKDAYLPPSVWSEVPRLIVPRDPAGISGPEVVESGKIVPITDAGAILNEKNKIVVDDDKMAELYFKEKSQALHSATYGVLATAGPAAATAVAMG